VVLYIPAHLSLRNSRCFSCGLVDDDMAVARDTMVLEDAIGRASPTNVCCNVDGTPKPLRMDVPATRKYRLFVSAGNELRQR